MKHNIIATLGVIGTAVGGIFLFGLFIYSLIGFMSWLFSDPFNWVDDIHPPQQYVDPDVRACRDKGGLPIKSAWDGRLKRCDNLP